MLMGRIFAFINPENDRLVEEQFIKMKDGAFLVKGGKPS